MRVAAICAVDTNTGCKKGWCRSSGRGSSMESTEGTRARRAVPSRAKTTRFGDTAALFEALGGGWWNRKSDVAEAETAKPLNHSKAPQPLFPTMPVENTSPFKGQWGKQCGEDRHWLKLSRHSSA